MLYILKTHTHYDGYLFNVRLHAFLFFFIRETLTFEILSLEINQLKRKKKSGLVQVGPNSGRLILVHGILLYTLICLHRLGDRSSRSPMEVMLQSLSK